MAKVIGYALIIVGYFYGPWWTAAGTAILAADSYEQGKRAKRRALAEYNASLADRLEMIDVSADAARTIVLGRVRAVEGVRRKWVSGDNNERLTMVVSFAGHEIDAFEGFYFNDVPLELDSGGYVLTEPYNKNAITTATTGTVEVPPGGYVNVSLPTAWVAGSLSAYQVNEGGDIPLEFTVAGDVATVGPADVLQMVYVAYQVPSYRGTARIRSWTGAPGQNVGAAIAADYPGKITSADKFAGMAVAVIDIEFDPDIYVQGRPNVTALMRGAKVYDPRADSSTGGSGTQRADDSTTWTWSENPALHALHYATHTHGWAVPLAEISRADIVQCADVCAASTVYTLRQPDTSTTTVTLPRYRCGIQISTGGDPREAMNEIIEAMAGRSGWAGGQWRIKAGHMPAPVFDLDPSWLARPVEADGTAARGALIQFSNGVARDQKVNRVSGKCVNPSERYQALAFPAVEDAVLIAAEGSVYPLEVELQGVNHTAHAQNIARILIRQSQASLRAQVSCNLHAYRVELFDVGRLTLPRYGMSDKTVEVRGWSWSPTEGVQLQLAEITEAIFDPTAELTGQDPAPNSDLPPPWQVEDLAGLAVSSGTVPLSDGSILTRTLIEWTPAVSQSIRAGGKVQVQYIEAAADLPEDWPIWDEAGGAASAIIPALKSGSTYLFRARFVTSAPLAVRGKWSTQVAHTVALPPIAAGQYTDFIFQRSASVPTTPTGSGTPSGWFDAPPAADGNPLWVSFGVKRADGVLLDVWSDPVQIDGASIQVQYSVDGATAWHDTFTPGDVYARYRIGASGTWSAAVKIVAEDGTSKDFVFQRSASAPSTPTGDTPAGWSDAPPVADGNALWVSFATRDAAGAVLGTWSSPVQLEGASIQVQYSVDGVTSWHDTFAAGADIYARYRVGDAGTWSDAVKIVAEDGKRTDYIFKRSASAPSTPTGDTPAGWVDAPPAADGNPLWASVGVRTPAGALVGSWSAPVQLEGASIQVQYSIDGATLWHDTFAPGTDIYARYRVGDAGTWSAAVQIVGENGVRTAVLDMYRWSASAPVSFPSGSSTYTWATGQFTAPATPNGWSLSPGAGTSGDTLYVCRQIYSDTANTSTSSVTWSASTSAPRGAYGSNGTRTAFLELYRWAASTPATFPSGSSTYTWATGAFTLPGTPNSWSLLPGAPTPGWTLWACSVSYTDTATTSTSSVAWSTSTAYAIGAAGSAGTAGSNGNSAAVCYALYTGNPSVTGTSVIKSGTTLPATTDFSPTAATAFSVSVQTPAAGQALFVSDGIYNPVTNQTTWGVPYLASLKVGQLSAIVADLGQITSGNIATTGYITVGGSSTLSLTDPLAFSGVSKTVSIAGNVSGSSQVGVVGIGGSGGYGVYGFISSTSATFNAAVVGVNIGSGWAGLFSGGKGLYVSAATDGMVVESANATSSTGLLISAWTAIDARGLGSGGVAVKATAASGGTALQVVGSSTYAGAASFTSTASVTLSATSSSTGRAIAGISAGAGGTGVYADGSAGGFALYVNGNLRLDVTNTSGGATAGTAFLGTKPGASTPGEWLLVYNGTRPGRMAWWPDA